MRALLIAIIAAATLGASLLPAFADTNNDCNGLPKSEWAKCVFDQAAETGSQ